MISRHQVSGTDFDQQIRSRRTEQTMASLPCRPHLAFLPFVYRPIPSFTRTPGSHSGKWMDGYTVQIFRLSDYWSLCPVLVPGLHLDKSQHFCLCDVDRTPQPESQYDFWCESDRSLIRTCVLIAPDEFRFGPASPQHRLDPNQLRRFSAYHAFLHHLQCFRRGGPVLPLFVSHLVLHQCLELSLVS